MDSSLMIEKILSVNPDEFEMPEEDKLRKIACALAIEDKDTGMFSEQDAAYSVSYTVTSYDAYGILF